jgi:hypothetical protein
MQKQISKGSEEAQFWVDLMKFRQVWYSAKDDKGNLWNKDSDEWGKLVDSAGRLTKKYEGTEFYLVCQAMILAYLEFLEKEYKMESVDGQRTSG